MTSNKKKIVRNIYKVGFYVLIAAWILWMVALLVDMLPDIVDGILNDPVPFYVILGLLLVFALYQIGVWAWTPDRDVPDKDKTDEA